MSSATTSYEEVDVEDFRYENQQIANGTIKIQDVHPEYENVEFGSNQSKEKPVEDHYAMGRRFPSFRLTSAQKKERKKAQLAEKER